MSNHAVTCSCSTRSRVGAIGLGFVAGLATAAGTLLSRKMLTAAKVGAGHPLKHRVLDFAASTMQRKYPVEAMSTYLNGIHLYADDMGRQVEACHFCIHLQQDLHQCVIFDSNKADARLIGIEYIISADRFARLPEVEKLLWHSHHYEVKSGMLVSPGIPELAERAYFKDLVSTYGKTFHNWQIDTHDFPYGIPQLMMGFTADGQVDPAKLAARDTRIGISSDDRRLKRSGIPAPTPLPGSNSWESGRSLQTRLEEVDFKRS